MCPPQYILSRSVLPPVSDGFPLGGRQRGGGGGRGGQHQPLPRPQEVRDDHYFFFLRNIHTGTTPTWSTTKPSTVMRRMNGEVCQ